MKVRLNTLIVVVSLAVFLLGGGSHLFAQTTSPAQAGRDPDLQAIRDNTISVKGQIFPKLRSAMTESTGGCCNIGDTRSQEVMWPNYEKQGVKPKGKVTHRREEPYSPVSTCWVISGHRLVTNSESGSNSNLTAVPANYSFVTSGQYEQTYNGVKNLVLNMNILNKFKVDLVAKLEQFTKNYASYAQSLSASHGSLVLYTELTSKGVFGGRSWYRGVVLSTETCCPPEIRDPGALRTALTEWVNETVNALPNKGRGTGRTFNYGNIIGVPLDQKDMKGYVFTPGATPSPTPR